RTQTIPIEKDVRRAAIASSVEEQDVLSGIVNEESTFRRDSRDARRDREHFPGARLRVIGEECRSLLVPEEGLVEGVPGEVGHIRAPDRTFGDWAEVGE